MTASWHSCWKQCSFFPFATVLVPPGSLFCVQLSEGCKLKENDLTVVVAVVNTLLTLRYKY